MLLFFTKTMMFIHMFVGLILIGLILLQRGRGGGLAGAFGGMGGQSAFGTKAGDVFTKITIWIASIWILLGCICVVMASNFKGNKPQLLKGLPANIEEKTDTKKDKEDEEDKGVIGGLPKPADLPAQQVPEGKPEPEAIPKKEDNSSAPPLKDSPEKPGDSEKPKEPTSKSDAPTEKPKEPDSKPEEPKEKPALPEDKTADPEKPVEPKEPKPE